MENLSGEEGFWSWLLTRYSLRYPMSDVMWTYEQSSGKMIDPNGLVVGFGYAGGDCGTVPEGKNNPLMQDRHNIGPLPQGSYSIGKAYTHPRLGPITMNLDPYPGNKMFGRGEFRIHGDDIASPGNGSDGCIVQARTVREDIDQSLDKLLVVTAGPELET